VGWVQEGVTQSRKEDEEIFQDAAGCILAHRSPLKCDFYALENNHLNGDSLPFLQLSA